LLRYWPMSRRAAHPSPIPDAGGTPSTAASPCREGEERRAAPRVSLEVDVSIESDSHFFVGLSGDISRGGLFVATWRKLPVGAAVEVALSLPGGQVLAHGTVRWVRDLSEGVNPGFGVAFEELSAEARARVEAFCAAQTPYYYDVDE